MWVFQHVLMTSDKKFNGKNLIIIPYVKYRAQVISCKQMSI
uniref:Uncharacterized protein n=1 Tax=Rhizophora mucronata TaxID=61149 RepID=A0A2P2J2L0_RHIMU